MFSNVIKNSSLLFLGSDSDETKFVSFGFQIEGLYLFLKKKSLKSLSNVEIML